MRLLSRADIMSRDPRERRQETQLDDDVEGTSRARERVLEDPHDCHLAVG